MTEGAQLDEGFALMFAPKSFGEFTAWREREDRRRAAGYVEIPAGLAPVLMRGTRRLSRKLTAPVAIGLYNLGPVNTWCWDKALGGGRVVVVLRSVFKFDGEVLVCDSPVAVNGWTQDQITAERLRWDNRELNRLGVDVPTLEFVE